MSDSGSSSQLALEALLAEFNALRDEISNRSSAQLQLITLNVSAVGVIGGAFLSQLTDPRVLFVIPVISPLIGMLYLDHGVAIGNLGRFIQTEIKPAIQREVERQTLPDFETHVRKLESNTGERLTLLGFPTLFMFGILPLAALIAPFASLQLDFFQPVLWLVSVPGLALLFIFALNWWRFIRLSERYWA